MRRTSTRLSLNARCLGAPVPDSSRNGDPLVAIARQPLAGVRWVRWSFLGRNSFPMRARWVRRCRVGVGLARSQEGWTW
jgi:hypothetical protein